MDLIFTTDYQKEQHTTGRHTHKQIPTNKLSRIVKKFKNIWEFNKLQICKNLKKCSPGSPYSAWILLKGFRVPPSERSFIICTNNWCVKRVSSVDGLILRLTAVNKTVVKRKNIILQNSFLSLAKKNKQIAHI